LSFPPDGKTEEYIMLHQYATMYTCCITPFEFQIASLPRTI